MRRKKLSEIFDINYGTKLDLNKMEPVESVASEAVPFVSRTSKNLGVVGYVMPVDGIVPLRAGLITVSLGGSYLLSSFVQKNPFYSAQNVAILSPKIMMGEKAKLFYCICIERNRFKYSAFGREANRSLRDILVPAEVPDWISGDLETTIVEKLIHPMHPRVFSLKDRHWEWFEYQELFEIKKGQRVVNKDLIEGKTPCIRPIEFNNGIKDYIDIVPNHAANTITVSYNGSVGEAFYQNNPYFAVDDINVLYPKFTLTPGIAMFLITLIRKEQYRYNYGRKWHLGRMRESIIKLPVKADGVPDWKFMENYIFSLQFSSSISSFSTSP